MKKKLSFNLEKVFGMSYQVEHGYVDEISQMVFCVIAITNPYNEQDDCYLQEIQKKKVLKLFLMCIF